MEVHIGVVHTPKEISIEVDGDPADVVATIDQDGDTCSLVVAPRAQVVSVRGGTDAVIASERDLTVTLALTEDSSVLGLIFAADEADLTIVRATRTQDTTIEGSFCGPSMAPAGNGAQR